MNRAALAVALGLLGCDQLTATEQAVSVLTAIPELEETEGLPPGLYEAVTAAAGDAELGAVVALAAITERESVAETTFTPLSGAIVELESAASVVELCEQETAGTYTASTLPDDTCGGERLEYTVGAKYVTAIETASQRYTLTIDSAPAPASSVAILPAFGTANELNVPTHPSGTALSVDWSSSPGELDGFVTLFRIEYIGSDPADVQNASSWRAAASNPVFDNFPTDANDALNFAIGDPVSTANIPASALTETGLYLLIVTAVELSDTVSSNLSLGSYMIAGAGRSWAFWVE